MLGGMNGTGQPENDMMMPLMIVGALLVCCCCCCVAVYMQRDTLFPDTSTDTSGDMLVTEDLLADDSAQTDDTLYEPGGITSGGIATAASVGDGGGGSSKKKRCTSARRDRVVNDKPFEETTNKKSWKECCEWCADIEKCKAWSFDESKKRCGAHKSTKIRKATGMRAGLPRT